MRHIIILGDGMADEPIPSLGNRTPLQAAHTPYMDMLARKGRNGRLNTIPDGFNPGSEIANLSVLGYDLPAVFEGRGVLEAASMGVEILPGELAMRCNLVYIEEDRLINHSAGHISSKDAEELIRYLNRQLADNIFHFYPGVSYRHLLKMKGGDKRLQCTPPHDIPEQPFRPHLISASHPDAEETASAINRLIVRSQELLQSHPINKRRIAEGKNPANSIWPWSPGYRPRMKQLSETYPITAGSVISAVDLVRGIGVYAGLEVVLVEGATGLHDTNYEGKAAAALKELKEKDFVYLHVEASDEAVHEGDADLKGKTIEYLDARIERQFMKTKGGRTVASPSFPTIPLFHTYTPADAFLSGTGYSGRQRGGV